MSEPGRVAAALVRAGWGVLGGAVGAFAAQLAWALLHRWSGQAGDWLKGPHGTAFFDLALTSGVYYGCLGAALGRGRRRLGAAAACGLAAFGLIAVPMGAATRVWTWGEGSAAPTEAWANLVLTLYGAANVGAALAAGLSSERPVSWRRALGALSGMAAARIVQVAAIHLRLAGFGGEPEVIGYLPPPSALNTGILWGAFTGLGLGMAERGDHGEARGG